MDNGLLVVKFDSLRNASADISKALAELNTKLDHLKTQGSQLAETWDGAAKHAYYLRQDAWTKTANDLAEILRQIQLAVEDSASEYQNTERKATNRFQ